MRRHSRLCSVLVVVGLLVAACGGDDDAPSASTTSADTTTTPADDDTTTTPGPDDSEPSGTTEPTLGTTAPPADQLLVLVTNDDGIEAPGLDLIVQRLDADIRFEVVVVAPLENQSGTSDSLSEDEPAVVDAETASGFAAHAVDGFPGDAVVAALDELGYEPDLVVSGINKGQNIGPLAELSGTVGAARVAARRGIPAIALSAGNETPEADYKTAASVFFEQLEYNLSRLLQGRVMLLSINVPSCVEGEVRDTLELPAGTEDRGQGASADCTSEVEEPFIDDVDAYVNGFATIAEPGF